MNKLYVECFSGISGDMFAAAMLDLGADREVLKEVLASVPVQGFETRISRVKKAGLDVCDFDVVLSEELENYDHDMEYLHGHSHTHTHTDAGEHTHTHADAGEHTHTHADAGEHTHTHADAGEHTHTHADAGEHTHAHAHTEPHTHHVEDVPQEHHHAHAHRGMQEVLEILQNTRMTEHARELAVRIFTILGQAEAKAHGTTLEEVHFHEVGAVDSIVDIITAAVCLDNLGITETILPVLYEGGGTIRCQHGILPVPVPAVSNIIETNGIDLHMTGMQGELVTPTGAAIAAAIRTSRKLPERFVIKKIGMGGGKRNYEAPGILRAMLIEEEQEPEQDVIYRLESNLDDCTGECFGHILDCLMKAGARDVSYTPVYMKKNRPAYQLNVICTPEMVSDMERIIFRETTTIGIRKVKMERSILKREIKEISTALGTATVKLCELEGEIRVYPEYSSVVELCEKSGLPYGEVFQIILQEGRNQA